MKPAATLNRPDPSAPTGIVRWENPPPKQQGKHGPLRRTVKALFDLQQNPGTWGLIRFYPKLKSGCIAASQWKRLYERHGFEFVGRRQPDGKRSALYGRYVGKNQ